MLFFEHKISDSAKVQSNGARHDETVRLINLMENVFGQIVFVFRPTIPIINAQALFLNGKRSVILFGGLAYNPSTNTDLLTFILLHEIGHHLGGGNRLPWNPFLACECSADRFAVGDGMALVKAVSGAEYSLNTAIQKLQGLITASNDFATGSNFNNSNGTDCQGCWATDWRKRKQALSSCGVAEFSECPLAILTLKSMEGTNGYGSW